MPALRGAWPWLVGGLALLVANVWLVLSSVQQFDESWTLQLVRRVADGDALYGDIHFGVTPLSIYVLLGLTTAFGEQILVVKGLSALLAAGAGLLVARICLQAGVSRFGAALCALLTVPLAPAFSISHYTPLAMLFLLACESCALTACERRDRRWLVAAGACAGLAFASKQNIGAVAFCALLATVLVCEWSPRRFNSAVVVFASFAGVACATVAAMAATGGVRRTADALLLAKGAYLDRAAIPYLDALRARGGALVRPTAWHDVIVGRDRDLLLASPRTVLPVLTAVLLAAAWLAWARRAAPRPRRLDSGLVVVTFFAVAGFLAAYPRYDAVHLGWTAGPSIVACAGALARLGVAGSRATHRGALVVAASAWAVFALLGPANDWRSGDRVHPGLSHFTGAWMPREERDRAARSVRRLEQEVPDHRVFIALGNASFYYLAARLENPTRFDFPAPTILGQRELDEVTRDVASGDVAAACISDEPPTVEAQRSLELEQRLRKALRRGPDVGLCRLWLRR